jgi:hypothetical protein
VFLDGINF